MGDTRLLPPASLMRKDYPVPLSQCHTLRVTIQSRQNAVTFCFVFLMEELSITSKKAERKMLE